MSNETKRDGNWIDEFGSCKVCGGEIPEGHANYCDIWKLERRIKELEESGSSMSRAVKTLPEFNNLRQISVKLDKALHLLSSSSEHWDNLNKK